MVSDEVNAYLADNEEGSEEEMSKNSDVEIAEDSDICLITKFMFGIP